MCSLPMPSPGYRRKEVPMGPESPAWLCVCSNPHLKSIHVPLPCVPKCCPRASSLSNLTFTDPNKGRIGRDPVLREVTELQHN